MSTTTRAVAAIAILSSLVTLFDVTSLPVTAAQAETYPSRPITMIVGFPPGGPTDTLARIVAEGMKTPLGQTVIIENAGGAGGTVGTARVVHANPDGYTIGIGNWTSHVGSPAIFNVAYDVIDDLQPVAVLAAAPLWILGRNDLAPRSASELIAWLKSSPNPTAFATVGAGSAAHLCGLYFAQKTGARFQFVPYHGAGPIIQDLMAGHIDLSCLDTSSTLADVQADKFRAYALMTDARWPKSPDTPTMSESGAPGLTISFWHGLWVPKGTPKDVVERLNSAVKTALADPVIRERLEAIGQVIAPLEQQTPAGLAAYHKSEIDKWWPIIKAAGIKVD